MTDPGTWPRGCEFCAGAGILIATPLTTADDPTPVWCRCPRGRVAYIVLRALQAHLDLDGRSPTIRELSAACGVSDWTATTAVRFLTAAGMVAPRPYRARRALRLVPTGEETR